MREQTYILARLQDYSNAPGKFIQVHYQAFTELQKAIDYAAKHRCEIISTDGTFAMSIGTPDDLTLGPSEVSA